jgi:hypothetical protein
MSLGKQHIKPLGIIGTLGGAAALAAILLEGGTFGYPGSAAYRVYEAFNRFMAVFLALQICSFLAIYIEGHEMLGKVGLRLVKFIVATWIAMAIGTAAEFWLYSDLPYPNSPADFNMRTAAFALFFFGSIAAGISLLILGIRLFRNSGWHRLLAGALLLYLPLYFFAFFSGYSIFIAPAVASMVGTGIALTRRSFSTAVSEK